MLVAERTSTRDAFWVTVIFFLYFLHPLNVKLGFQAFQCDSVCGVQYLSASLVERWSASKLSELLKLSARSTTAGGTTRAAQIAVGHGAAVALGMDAENLARGPR